MSKIQEKIDQKVHEVTVGQQSLPLAHKHLSILSLALVENMGIDQLHTRAILNPSSKCHFYFHNYLQESSQAKKRNENNNKNVPITGKRKGAAQQAKQEN